MLAHDRIDLFSAKGCDVHVGTEAAIGERDILGLKEAKEFSEEFLLVHVQSAFGPVQQRAAMQAEAADELGRGESAACLLGGGLRKSPLILGCIGHGDARAINDFDVASAPELIAADAPLEFVGGVAVNALHRIQRQTGTGAAVGAGVGCGPAQTPGGVPGLDFANRLAAGASGC